jgi:pimeloyl-ACP methyl ester carboxylesterase
MSRSSLVVKAFRAALRILSYIAPGLAGRVATRIWFTPVLWSSTKSYSIPERAEAVHFDRGSDEVTGFRIGDGPKTALLVHGWAGSARQYRRLTARLVDAGFECVVIDLPGHGPAAGGQTDVIEMADAITAAVRGIGHVDLLVAHSLGAASAVRALQTEAHADVFVVIAPGVFPRRAFQQFSTMLNLRPPVAAVVERTMDRRFGVGVLDRAGTEMLASVVPDRTLIVHDVEDEMIPIADVRRLAEAWQAPLVEVSGYGHNGALSATKVIDLVVEFASERVAAPPAG